MSTWRRAWRELPCSCHERFQRRGSAHGTGPAPLAGEVPLGAPWAHPDVFFPGPEAFCPALPHGQGVGADARRALCAAVGSLCGCWEPRGAGSCVRRGRWFPFGRLLHVQDGLLQLKHSPGALQLMARRGTEALGQVGQVFFHLGLVALVTAIWQRGFPSHPCCHACRGGRSPEHLASALLSPGTGKQQSWERHRCACSNPFSPVF